MSEFKHIFEIFMEMKFDMQSFSKQNNEWSHKNQWNFVKIMKNFTFSKFLWSS